MSPEWFLQLSTPVQTLLLGASANFSGGLAAKAVELMLGLSSNRIRKKFQPEPRRRALNLALAKALSRTVGGLTDDPNLTVSFLEYFGKWLERDEVVDELCQVIDPRPGAEIDLELLAREFEAAGFEPGQLGEGQEFTAIAGQLVHELYLAAATDSELQGAIEIQLLAELAEKAGQQGAAVERLAERLAPDLEPRRRNYLQRVVGDCGVLPLRGIDLKVSDASGEAAEAPGPG